MPIDQAQEWRRLTEHYRSMSDEQLRELAFDFADLTEMAQQVLRDELRMRGLNLPRSGKDAAESPPSQLMPWRPPSDEDDRLAGSFEADEDGSLPHDYTWKTQLCECENAEQAWQISEVLRRAGIESFTQTPQSGLVYHRILVAADQLEEARVIASRPIPQDVMDESRLPVPEFVVPSCPSCGAHDPLLIGVDPVNTWRCEMCGREWSDSASMAAGGADKP